MIAKASHGANATFLATLGLMPPCTADDIEQAYLAKVRVAHPDAGGDCESFNQLQAAYQRATEYVRSHSMLNRWFSSWIARYVEQEHVIDEVRRLGGRVDIERREWLKQEVGEDFVQIFDKVVGIHLRGQQVGDEALEYLMRNRVVRANLRLLDLAESRVTDEGLRHLRVFKNLRQLDLRGTRITNQRLELLRWLPNLEELAIQQTRVSTWGFFKLWWYAPHLRVVSS